VKENSNLSSFRKSILGAAWLAFIALVFALALPLASPAQDTGYISGTVTDKSGAAIAGAGSSGDPSCAEHSCDLRRRHDRP